MSKSGRCIAHNNSIHPGVESDPVGASNNFLCVQMVDRLDILCLCHKSHVVPGLGRSYLVVPL